LNWRLSVVAISVVPISISVISLLSKPIGKYAKNEQQSMECIMAVAQDSLSGVYIEKAYNLSGIMQNKFEDAVNKGLVNSLKRQKITSYLTPFQTITKWIPLLLCAIYGGYFVFYNQITTGSLFAFIYLLQYFVEPISKIQDFLSEFRGVSVSIERINELLTMENERSDGESYKLDLSKAILTFNNVCFGYPEENQTLKDISFTIEHRKSVALVGGSGSGKSTIFKLICGFYQAQSGSISLCENNLDLWDLDKAREQIALVSQDVYLFPTTIIENISIGRSEATLEEIINAAKMANAHEFILQLSDGYNTIVGERGCNLSGGQKQRISIARAILKNAPIILLDEPTSALDVQSEVMVQNALNRLSGKHTIIVIAHRLTTIKNVDKILVMDKGMIVEEGNHEQLIAKDGVYKKLYIRQIKNIDNSNLVQGV
jgi:ABC-type multidrug transport system fused ATPase/permease subunit